MNIKWLKRELSVLVSLSMLLPTVLGNSGVALAAVPAVGDGDKAAATASFSDVSASYAKKEIEALALKGILSGYEDGTFGPQNPMTRAEFAKVLALSANLGQEPQAAEGFKDVPVDAWYKGYVGALVKSGITEGTANDSFSPAGLVSREQLAVFFVRAMELGDNAGKAKGTAVKSIADMAKVSDWAKESVQLAFDIGFVQGSEDANGTVRFLPEQNAERQALARLAYEFVTEKDTYVDRARKWLKTTPAPSATPSSSPAAAFPGGGGFIGGGGGTVTAPAIVGARSTGTDKVEITFDKTVTEAKVADYSITGLTIHTAEMNPGNGKVVILTTGIQTLGASYPVLYKSAATNFSITGSATEVSSLAAGTYTGNYKVARGVEKIGPESGEAVIQGLLQLDPGADKEILVRNVKANVVEVLSGASHSITLDHTTVTDTLKVKAPAQSDSVRILALGNTSVTNTSVESKAILEVRSGDLGDIAVQGGAAGQRIELRGHYSGTVTVAAEGTALEVSEGELAGEVQLAASGVQVEVSDKATVSKIMATYPAVINSKGIVEHVKITSPVHIELNGNVKQATVAAKGASLKVAKGAHIGTILLQANAQVEADGSVTSIELASDTITVVLTGTQKEQVSQQALQAAAEAISALPKVVAMEHLASVKAARGKVRFAVAIGLEVNQSSLAVLESAESQVRKLIALAANEAFAKLPSSAALIGLEESSRSEARAKLAAAQEAYNTALSEGVTQSELKGWEKLQLVEEYLAALQELAASIAEANDRLDALPLLEGITQESADAVREQVKEAEKTMIDTINLALKLNIPPMIERWFLKQERLTAIKDKLDDFESREATETPKLIENVYPGARYIAIKADNTEWVEAKRANGESLGRLYTSGHEEISLYVANEALLQPGEELLITAKSPNKKRSQPLVVTVMTPSMQTNEPKLKGQVFENSNLVSGRAEVYATVFLLNNLGKVVGSTYIHSDQSAQSKEGEFTLSMNPLRPIHAGDILQLVAVGLRKLPSKPLPIIVQAASGVTDLYEVKGTLYENAMSLAGLTEPEAYVAISGKAWSTNTRADKLGMFTLSFVRPMAVFSTDEQVKITAMAIGKGVSEAVLLPVIPLDGTTATPTISVASAVYEDGFHISGTTEENAYVHIMSENGVEYGSYRSNQTSFRAENMYAQLPAGSNIIVTATVFGKKTSEPVRIPVQKLTSVTKAPTVTDDVYVFENGFIIEGSTESPATVEFRTDEGVLLTSTITWMNTFHGEAYDLHLKPGSEVWVTAKQTGQLSSEPIRLKVKPLAGITPAPSITQTVYEGAERLEVNMPLPSSYTVTKSDGTVIAQSNYRQEGRISIYFEPEVVLEAGEVIQLQTQALGMQPSPWASATVTSAVYQTPAPQVYAPLYEGTYNNVPVVTEPDSLLVLKKEDGTELYRGRLLGNAYSFQVRLHLRAGENVYLTAKLPEQRVSEAVKLVVLPAPSTITDSPHGTGVLYEDEDKLQGVAEPGAIIESYTADGLFSTSAITQENGSFQLHFYSSLARQSEIYITAQSHGKLPSPKVKIPVLALAGQTAAPTVTYATYSDIQGFAEPGSKVTVNNLATFVTDDNGLFSGSYYSPNNKEVVVRAEKTGKQASKVVTLAVYESSQTYAPYVAPIYADLQTVSVASESNASLSVYDASGALVGSGWGSPRLSSLHLNRQLVEGERLSVTAQVNYPKFKSVSDPVYMTVSGMAPVIATPVLLGVNYDTAYGQAEPGSKLQMLYKGKQVWLQEDIKMDQQGYFSIDMKGLSYGSYELYAQKQGKRDSLKMSITYPEPTIRSNAPVIIGEIDEESTVIPGYAEPGASVSAKTQAGVFLGKSIASNAGFYAIKLPYMQIEGGQTISITSQARGKAMSEKVPLTVKKPALSTAKPTVTSVVYEYTNIIWGTAEAGAKVWVEDKFGRTVSDSGNIADSRGEFALSLKTDELLAGMELIVFAKKQNKLVSLPQQITVVPYGTYKLPQPSVIRAVYEDDTTVTVQVYSRYTYQTVVVKDEQGRFLGSASFYGQGDIEINLLEPAKAHTNLQIYAKAYGEDSSLPFITTVKALNMRTATPRVVESVYEGDLTVDIYPDFERDATISVFHEESERFLSSNYWGNGPLVFSLPDFVKEGDTLKLTAKENGKRTSESLRIKVLPMSGQTALPTATVTVTKNVYGQSLRVYGLAEPGAIVMIQGTNGVFGGTLHASTTDGTFEYVLNDYYIDVTNLKIEVYAKAKGKAFSDLVIVRDVIFSSGGGGNLE